MPQDPNALSKSIAFKWNMPGGGYDQWKKGDPAREKAQPVGAMLPRAPMTKAKVKAPVVKKGKP